MDYDSLGDSATDIAKAMAVVLSAGYGGAALMGAGGAGGAGAGAGLSEAGLAGEGAFGATNAMGGAGAFGPAGSAYYGAGAGLSEMGLAGQGAFTGTNVAGGAATGSGVGGATMGAAGGGGGLLQTLGGAAGKYGDLIAPLLGAAAGAQGNEAESSSTRKMDPRLDGPVYGEGGLVPRTQGLLAQQMTPEAQQGWLDMQSKGRGLLNTNVAPNGFGLFSGRKF